MQEIKLKTHLIVTDVHEEYDVKWYGSISNANPMISNNMPIFVIIGAGTRMELNTLNIKRIEECAKRLTRPRGRQSVTEDTSYIYIKEQDGNEKLIGRVRHWHIKQYQQMYDSFQYI